MAIKLPSGFPSNDVEEAKAWLIDPANKKFLARYDRILTGLGITSFLGYWRTAISPFLVDPSTSSIGKQHMYKHRKKVTRLVVADILDTTEVEWKASLEGWLKAGCKAFARRGITGAKETIRQHKGAKRKRSPSQQSQLEHRTTLKTEPVEIEDYEESPTQTRRIRKLEENDSLETMRAQEIKLTEEIEEAERLSKMKRKREALRTKIQAAEAQKARK